MNESRVGNIYRQIRENANTEQRAALIQYVRDGYDGLVVATVREIVPDALTEYFTDCWDAAIRYYSYNS